MIFLEIVGGIDQPRLKDGPQVGEHQVSKKERRNRILGIDCSYQEILLDAERVSAAICVSLTGHHEQVVFLGTPGQ
jgi:hypothetical protein